MAEGDLSTPLRIADLELHVELREIRLRGREIAVQPLVFDLLLYLMRNPERVVGKEELLGALRPMASVDRRGRRLAAGR
jgi:DNA-binding response OmpR family regulator